MAAPALDQLIAIPSLDPQGETALPFDLFVRLPLSNRVILYRREGRSLDQELFEKAPERQLNFFVQRTEYARYLEHAAREFLSLLSQPAARPRLRAAAGRVLTNAASQATPAEARDLMTHLGDVVGRFVREMALEKDSASRPGLFLKFARLAEGGTDFQRHPLNVASLTVMICLGLGIHDQKTLVEISLAGLLHDIGLTQLPVAVIRDSHDDRHISSVSKALLKLHPQGALDLLWNRGIQVSKLMEQMILQHHEQYNGSGYPRGLSGEAVHPLAQILRIADDLDEIIARAPAGKLEHRISLLFHSYSVDQVVAPAVRQQVRSLFLPE